MSARPDSLILKSRLAFTVPVSALSRFQRLAEVLSITNSVLPGLAPSRQFTFKDHLWGDHGSYNVGCGAQTTQPGLLRVVIF